jgi:hypothetical protein
MNPVNLQVAERFAEISRLLEAQSANAFRVAAYRHAAAVLRGLERSVDEIVQSEGLEGLQKLPGIGNTLARFIHQAVTTGRLPILDRLRGESDPITLLRTVPGIGKVSAERIHDQLGIETLEELELAAHDGRLARVMGFGEKRLAAIRDSLATRLGRLRTTVVSTSGRSQPAVAEILDVDSEYRRKSRNRLIPTIAPRRFNPHHKKWLPILHTSRGDRHYTALFSNTPRAHQLHKTSDWVVIYYDGAAGERQCTVITSMYGQLAGKRIVRGREEECMQHYRPANQIAHAAERPRMGFSP